MGITRAQLAKAVGRNQSTIWRIENGKRRPSPELSRSIETFFKGKITHTDLLFPDYSSQKSKPHSTFFDKVKTL
ncbi:helix-turn-helix transcriptional regulator [bacterium]|nr:helix-turn-helix transcriptional regulator [bacterium]